MYGCVDDSYAYGLYVDAGYVTSVLFIWYLRVSLRIAIWCLLYACCELGEQRMIIELASTDYLHSYDWRSIVTVFVELCDYCDLIMRTDSVLCICCVCDCVITHVGTHITRDHASPVSDHDRYATMVWND